MHRRRKTIASLSLACGCGAIALLSGVVGVAAPSRAQGPAWLGGDAVEVAPQSMALAPLPAWSDHPLFGYLAKPAAPGRHPAVVVLHGCGGFGTAYPIVAEVLKSYGYAALAIDSLGRLNACGSHGLGSLAEAFDAYRALGWLVRQDFVDARRVAVLGFSMGGIAALDDVEDGPGVIEKAQQRHFRAAVAYYPCTRYRAGVMTVPTLILVGDKDDWTPVSYCRHMMARRAGKGAAVTLTVYPGATHGFNFPGRARLYLGHRLAYDPQATADAWRQVRDFLETTLGRRRPAGGKRVPSSPTQPR